MRRFGVLVLACLLVACGHDEDNEAKVRVFNALYKYDSLDLFVDEDPQLEDLTYAALSEYVRLGIKQGSGTGGGGSGATTTSSSTSTVEATATAELSDRADPAARANPADAAAAAELANLVATSTTDTTTTTSTSSTTSTTLGSATRTFTVFVDTLVTSLIEQNVTLDGSTRYTLFAFDGAIVAPKLVVAKETKQSVLKGKLKIRVASMAPAAGAVDIYIVPAGDGIVGVTPVERALTPSELSAFFDVDPGQYDIILAQLGTKTVVFDSGPTDLLQGSVQTLVVYDKKGGGRPLESLLYDD